MAFLPGGGGVCYIILMEKQGLGWGGGGENCEEYTLWALSYLLPKLMSFCIIVAYIAIIQRFAF
jgi:hypothetical protein